MTPTRPRTLLALAAGFGLLTYLLAVAAYADLPQLPAYAPVTMVLLAVAELGMSRVIGDRLRARRRPGARVLHPMQIARAAALAKASSTAGALLLGVYSALLAFTLPLRGELVVAERDCVVAGLSALSCLALVAAALVLERACRVPEEPGLGSRT